MSKLDKLQKRLCAKPTPSDFKWDDLCKVLRVLGYQLLKNSGSRRKFYNKDKDLLISCHEPHPSSEVDKGCVADVVEHLRSNGLIEEED